MKNLNRLSAVEAAEGIKKKKFTSEELIKDCLSRINERENDIQAWSYVNTAVSYTHLTLPTKA